MNSPNNAGYARGQKRVAPGTSVKRTPIKRTSVNLKLWLPPISFNAFLEHQDAYRIRQRTPGFPGVSTIAYEVISRDQTDLTKEHCPNNIFESTVHDLDKISDAQMLQWGREAAADALAKGSTAGREWVGAASNGWTFRGYLDKAGNVTGFFPQM